LRYQAGRFAQEAVYRRIRRLTVICASLHETLVFLDIRAVLASLVTNMANQTFDHLTEIAEILAVGLTRLEERKSSRKSAEFGESSLHFTPDQSGDAPSCSAEASP
jgi:hypothetical protein